MNMSYENLTNNLNRPKVKTIFYDTVFLNDVMKPTFPPNYICDL